MGHFPNKSVSLELPSLPAADHYVLAFSGGSDSTALLHALIQNQSIKAKLSAIHVNHQVHKNADQWAEDCLEYCQHYDIPCHVKVICTEKPDENSLRQARYQAISKHLTTLSGSSIVLTAHHLNDDIETLLFRLVRGTGLNGLTGMSSFGHYQGIDIFRPLINTPKSVISQYLAAHSLNWIEDDSNRDTDYDRNFIRHKVIPSLTRLRPDAIQRMQDTRNHLTASLRLLEQLIGNDNPLPLQPSLSPQELATFLYHWLSSQGLNPPHHDQLLSFARSCLTAEADKLPMLKNTRFILKLWQHAIYVLRPHLLSVSADQIYEISVHSDTCHWQHEFGQLTIKAKKDMAIDLSIQFNVPGEKIKQPGHNQHQRVKELFRTAGIPPWQRTRLPYIYAHNTLMAVGSLISHDWQQWLTDHQAEYHWHPSNFLL